MSGARRAARAAVVLLVCAASVLWPPPGVAAQEADTRARLAALELGPIEWTPPVPDRHEVGGVDVFLLEDHGLPLVTVSARFRGGYGHFGREWYAAATALPALLRYGGTRELPPDTVDVLIERYALQTSFGTGGGSVAATMNTLVEHLPVAMDFLEGALARPRFDAAQVELWRERELEALRRRPDDPTMLAYSTFNRLLYGDHPIGWEMSPSDLEPSLLAETRLREVHGRIVCRENLVVGVTGDVTWSDMAPFLERLVAALRPCPAPLPGASAPQIRREAGVFLMERPLEQAVIVMAHPTSVRLSDDQEYFAAVIGNSILGGGGFSSRILGRVRTEEGYAYSAASLWTTPRSYDGVVGAVTSTRPETAVDAARTILAVMGDMRSGAPREDELRTAVDRIVNGWVFNFESPAQIVSRMMFYVAEDLPSDWLERYLEGVQRVTPDAVRRVFAEHVRPEDMTILVLGDPDRMGREELAALGPVTVLPAPGS